MIQTQSTVESDMRKRDRRGIVSWESRPSSRYKYDEFEIARVRALRIARERRVRDRASASAGTRIGRRKESFENKGLNYLDFGY